MTFEEAYRATIGRNAVIHAIISEMVNEDLHIRGAHAEAMGNTLALIKGYRPYHRLPMTLGVAMRMMNTYALVPVYVTTRLRQGTTYYMCELFALSKHRELAYYQLRREFRVKQRNREVLVPPTEHEWAFIRAYENWQYPATLEMERRMKEANEEEKEYKRLVDYAISICNGEGRNCICDLCLHQYGGLNPPCECTPCNRGFTIHLF